jgi:hypothetical protein
MYKKVINYTDFDGNTRSEAFYFNLTKAEMVKMELQSGGMQEMLQRIADAEDSYRVAEVIEDIICRSYGEKSLDGKRFVKSQEIVDSFKATDAYSELFMELLRDQDAAAAFINGIMPADLREAAEAEMAKGESKGVTPMVAGEGTVN